jgi:hypothetical protein
MFGRVSAYARAGGMRSSGGASRCSAAEGRTRTQGGGAEVEVIDSD